MTLQRRVAYVCRYGRQPYSEVMRMPFPVFIAQTLALSAIVRQEGMPDG